MGKVSYIECSHTATAPWLSASHLICKGNKSHFLSSISYITGTTQTYLCTPLHMTTMHLQIFAVVALTVSLACGLPAPASGNIQDPAENNRPFLVLRTNDGGSGDVNMIQLYYNLTKAGVRSIISAPPKTTADGNSRKEDDPRPLGDKGCDYNPSS